MLVVRIYEELNSRLEHLKDVCKDGKMRRSLYIEQRDVLVDKVDVLADDLNIFDKTRIFLQSVSDVAREQIKARLERIVTNALQAVRGPEYSFHVKIRPTATGRPEVDFLTITDVGGRKIESLPTLGKGGGVIDVIATTLKFAMLEIEDNDGIIWMDEPFKFVSEEYVENASKLLQYMGETSGRQIIAISHDAGFIEACNRRIRVFQKDGRAYVTREQ